MNSKFLLHNKHIYVHKECVISRSLFSFQLIVVEISEDQVFYITPNLTSGRISLSELDSDVKVKDVYDVIEYQFFDVDEIFLQSIVVYDKVNMTDWVVDQILLSLKTSPLYMNNDSFRRSLDISIICGDVYHLKEFFC